MELAIVILAILGVIVGIEIMVKSLKKRKKYEDRIQSADERTKIANERLDKRIKDLKRKEWDLYVILSILNTSKTPQEFIYNLKGDEKLYKRLKEFYKEVYEELHPPPPQIVHPKDPHWTKEMKRTLHPNWF